MISQKCFSHSWLWAEMPGMGDLSRWVKGSRSLLIAGKWRRSVGFWDERLQGLIRRHLCRDLIDIHTNRMLAQIKLSKNSKWMAYILQVRAGSVLSSWASIMIFELFFSRICATHTFPWRYSLHRTRKTHRWKEYEYLETLGIFQSYTVGGGSVK